MSLVAGPRSELAFSFTALQEFLLCPVSFFYRRLIRIPGISGSARDGDRRPRGHGLSTAINQHGQVWSPEKLYPVIERQLRAFDFAEEQALSIEAQAKPLSPILASA